MVAQELALRHPARVSSLALGCTMAGGPDTVVADRSVRRQLRDAYATGDREEVLRAGWEVNVSAGYREAHPERYAAFREMALSLPAPMALLMRQLGAISRHDTAARLAELAVPTLVVHGTEDRLIPVANGRRLGELVPGARLEVLDGVGHLFYWEQPERAGALVRSFCLGLGAADAPGVAASG
jgi:pimeloyl-ACP methyl ester carboxylesterase